MDSPKADSGNNEVEMHSLKEDSNDHHHDVSSLNTDDSYETLQSSQMDVKYREKWFENPKYFHGAVNPSM